MPRIPALSYIQKWLALLSKPEVYQDALATVFVLLAAGLMAHLYLLLLDNAGRRWFLRRTVSKLPERILRSIRKPGYALILLSGVYAALHRYRFGLIGFLDGLIFVVSACVVFFMLVRVLTVVLSWYAERIQGGEEGETVSRELIPLADKVLKIVLAGAVLVVILDRFGIKIESILVTLGVGSLAIGLALQDTLANMFGGFTIMLDRPFRIGDRIQLQTGELGEVRSIGMRSTNVLMPDGNLMIIPNAYMVKTILINHSVPDSRSMIKIELGLAYDADLDRAKRLMLEAAERHPRVMKSPAPAAFLRSFGDTSMRLLMTCYVSSFVDTVKVTDDLNSEIRGAFREAGIEFPVPLRNVYLRDDRGPSAEGRG
jgi:MscS family membrane protein